MKLERIYRQEQISKMKEFKEFITKEELMMGGFHIEFTFPNGYGASIVQHSFSYGLELAVLKYGHLYYESPITDDVIGYLTIKELKETLRKIQSLSNDESHILQPL